MEQRGSSLFGGVVPGLQCQVSDVSEWNPNAEEERKQVDESEKSFKRSYYVPKLGRFGRSVLLTASSLVIHRPPDQRRVKLYDRVDQLELPSNMTAFLRDKDVKMASSVQSCLWPAMNQLSSVVGVAGAGQGKTVGWILPLLSCLANDQLYIGLPEGSGPVALVCCSSLDQAVEVGDQVKYISHGADLDVRVIVAYRSDNPCLVNGCDILVTTAPCLLSMIDSNLTNLERLCHLVIEDCHRTLQSQGQQLRLLINNWRKVGEELPDQVVIVGELWTPQMEMLIEFLGTSRWNLLTVFGCLREAAIYSKVGMIAAYYDDHERRLSALVDLLQKRRCKALPTVICCQTVKRSAALKLLLSSEGISVKCPEEDWDVTVLESFLDDWKFQSPSQILLISDMHLSILRQSSIPGVANLLINWDLPSESKKIFALRFLFIKSSLEMDMDSKVKVHLLMSHKDHLALPNICLWLQRGGAVLSKSVIDIKSQHEEQKELSAEFCKDIILFGTCSARITSVCKGRHKFINSVDSPQRVGQEGEINFKVLQVESPVSFWVRFIGQELDKEYIKIVMGLARHFCQPDSWSSIKMKDIFLGNLVALRSNDGTEYSRAKICGHHSQHGEILVQVFLVDQGVNKTVLCGQLGRLPGHLADLWPTASLVVIVGLLPAWQEVQWNTGTLLEVASYLMGNNQVCERECRARVMLHTRSIMWVDRCQLMVKQPSLDRYVCQFETKSWLISQKLGVNNYEHFIALEKLAIESGLELPNQDTKSSSGIESDLECVIDEPEEDIIRQAFLPLSSAVGVVMSECLSPSHFYLQLASGLESLCRLETELSTLAENTRKLSNIVQEGDLVITRPGEGENYQRARVLSVDLMEVFMVDTGEILAVDIDHTIPCPHHLAVRIPAQAVQCQLVGVSPVDSDDWSFEAGDQLYEMSRDLETDKPLPLVCQVVPGGKDGNIYSVKLTITETDDDIDLSEQLVKSGLARWKTNCSLIQQVLKSDDLEFNKATDINADTLNVDQFLRDMMMDNNLSEDEVPIDSGVHLPANSNTNYQSRHNKNITTSDNTPTPSQIPLLTISQSNLPGLTVVQDISSFSRNVMWTKWNQASNDIELDLSVNTLIPLHQRQVHVEVKAEGVKVEVVELRDDDVILHSTPCNLLKLWANIVPVQSRVKIKGSRVVVMLSKLEPHTWPMLTEVKCGLVTRQDLINTEDDNGDKDFISLVEVKVINHQTPLSEENFDYSDDEIVPDFNIIKKVDNPIDKDFDYITNEEVNEPDGESEEAEV